LDPIFGYGKINWHVFIYLFLPLLATMVRVKDNDDTYVQMENHPSWSLDEIWYSKWITHQKLQVILLKKMS